jgi:hypothetical protein
MDSLLDFVLEVIFGIALEAFGALFAGRGHARRLEAIHRRRAQRMPSYFATLKRIAESK